MASTPPAGALAFSPGRLRRAVGLLVACVGLALSCAAAPPAGAAPSGRDTQALERQLLDLVNRERAAHGARPLKWNESLAVVARAHSRDMRERRFFAHLTPEGRTPLDRVLAAGIPFSRVGENLAFDRDVLIPHRTMMAEPPGQPNHRTTLLNPRYTDVGIGIVDDGEWLHITEDFIAAGPADAPEWDDPGRIAAGLGGVSASLDALSRRMAGLHERLGRLALATGDPKGAQEAFESAMREDPRCPGAQAGLGQVLESEGKPDAARAEYAKAVAAHPDDAAARLRLAELLLAAGQAADATPHFRAVTQLQPDNAAAWYGAARCTAATDPGDARRLLRRALALAPALTEKAGSDASLSPLVE